MEYEDLRSVKTIHRVGKFSIFANGINRYKTFRPTMYVLGVGYSDPLPFPSFK